MKDVFIYGLTDTLSGQLKYVGKTVNIPRRLRRHISERFLHDSYKDRWVRKVIDEGGKIEIFIIDIVNRDEWVFWEQHYISYFKFIGINLTNGTMGGDEPPSTKGRKHTEESKLKMSNSKKGKPIPWLNDGSVRTNLHRENLSKSLKGRNSPNKGKKFSDEYKLKLSESSTCKKKVIQLKKDGTEIKIWDSITEAQNALQIKHISEVCMGSSANKTSGGFLWKYYEK